MLPPHFWRSSHTVAQASRRHFRSAASIWQNNFEIVEEGVQLRARILHRRQHLLVLRAGGVELRPPREDLLLVLLQVLRLGGDTVDLAGQAVVGAEVAAATAAAATTVAAGTGLLLLLGLLGV